MPKKIKPNRQDVQNKEDFTELQVEVVKAKTNYQSRGTLAQALKYRQINTYSHSNLSSYSMCEPQENLASHGPALILFNNLYSILIKIMFIAVVLSAASIYINFKGSLIQKINKQTSFLTLVAKTTLGNYESSEQGWAIEQLFVHVSVVLVFLMGIIYYRYSIYSKEQIILKSEHYARIQDYSIVVKSGKNSLYNQSELMKMATALADGNSPVMITPVFDFNGDLARLLQISSIDLQLNRLKINRTDDLDMIAKKQQQKSQLMQEISFFNKSSQWIYSFITYSRKSIKDSAVSNAKKYWMSSEQYILRNIFCCFKEQTPHQMLYLNQQLVVKSTDLPQPQSLLWQNLDVPLWKRIILFIIMILIILLVISFSVFCQGIFSVLSKAQLGVNCNSAVPTFAQASVSTDKNIVICYCVGNIASLTDTNILNLCYPYLTIILSPIFLQVGVAILSSIFNPLLLMLSRFLVLRMRLQTKQIQSLMILVISFINYITNSAILPLLLTSNIYGFIPADGAIFLLKIFNFNVYSLTFYNDFSSDWYLSFSSYLVIFLLTDLSTPLITLLIAAYKNCGLQSRLVQLQKQGRTQLQLNISSVPFIFNLESQLSQVLGIVFIVLTFGSGIPLLYAVGFINLLLRLTITRFIFFNYTRKIMALNLSLLRSFAKMLVYSLIPSVLFSVWMFSIKVSPSLPGGFLWFTFSTSAFWSRVFQISFLPLLAIAIAITIVMDYSIINIISSCFQTQSNNLDNEFEIVSNEQHHLMSYEMRKNPDYFQIAAAQHNYKKH